MEEKIKLLKKIKLLAYQVKLLRRAENQLRRGTGLSYASVTFVNRMFDKHYVVK